MEKYTEEVEISLESLEVSTEKITILLEKYRDNRNFMKFQ